MKTEYIFGVKMTSLQEMRFSKYLDNNGIAMNTLSKEKRKEVAEKCLNDLLKIEQEKKFNDDWDDYYYEEIAEREAEERYNDCTCGSYTKDGLKVADCIC